MFGNTEDSVQFDLHTTDLPAKSDSDLMFFTTLSGTYIR